MYKESARVSISLLLYRLRSNREAWHPTMPMTATTEIKVRPIVRTARLVDVILVYLRWRLDWLRIISLSWYPCPEESLSSSDDLALDNAPF